MPASREQIAEVLKAGSPWSEGEKWVVKWQFGLLGDFEKALAEALMRADNVNLARLAAGFPEQAFAFIEWNRGDLAERFRAAGLEI